MKVLINSYACSPYKGSEPGMGWNFIKALSLQNELHIITEEKFRVDIENYLSEHPECTENMKFYYVKRTRYKTLRKIWPPSYYWTYKTWQKKVLRLAVELDSKENFDIVHQLNMAGYREPGYLWQINKPFVWGPIGGFGKVPWCLIPTMNLWGIVFYTCHNIINSWQMHTSCRVKKAMQRANALFAATKECQVSIKKLYGRDSIIIPEVGLVGDATNQIAQRKTGEKLRICWSGLHIPRKSLNLLLDALALSNNDNIELHVIGEGSETNNWKKKAEKLGLGNVIWHGWVKRDEGMRIMQECHVFCITSLSDLTSTVILEALSFGLPVITLDHCGFSNVITEKCGIKIAINKKKQVLIDFAVAINKLEADEVLRYNLAKGAQAHSLDYKWEEKANVINSIYETLSIQNL